MKLTRRALQLDQLKHDLWQLAPWLLLVVVAGLVAIMLIWGRG